MRKFRVEIEAATFELEVEEYKQVPLIGNQGQQRVWTESAHNENVHACPLKKHS